MQPGIEVAPLVVGSDRMTCGDLRSGAAAGLRGQGTLQEGGYSFCLCHTAMTFRWERGRGGKDTGFLAWVLSPKKATEKCVTVIKCLLAFLSLFLLLCLSRQHSTLGMNQ